MDHDVRLIAAVGRRGQIGLNGKLPWPRDEADMAWFVKNTAGGALIVGKRTADGLGWKNGDILSRERVVLVPDMRHHLFNPRLYANIHATRTKWVCGGAAVYRAFAPLVRYSIITHIDYDGEADAWFPWDAFGSST